MDRTSELLYGIPRQDGGPYSDPYRALPVKLHRTREAFTACVRPTFQTQNLTDPQWRVLRILSAVDEIDSTELAKRSMLLGPSLSRILRDLDGRKLITRRACGLDARRSLASIAPAGRALIDAIAPQLDPIFDRLKATLDATKIEALNALLDEVFIAIDGGNDQPVPSEPVGS